MTSRKDTSITHQHSQDALPLTETADDGRRTQTTRLGRKRDDTRDDDLLAATLDVLAEVGYDGLTMDVVARRAGAGKATIYRRWSSKDALLLDAVAHMKRVQVDLDHLPDTGTLRGDLLALFKPHTIEEAERRLAIMAGIASMLSVNKGLAEAVHAAIVEPWATAHRMLMERAAERGEIRKDADIAAASQVVASMAAYRSLIQRKPFEREFLVGLIDGVLLPALGLP